MSKRPPLLLVARLLAWFSTALLAAPVVAQTSGGPAPAASAPAASATPPAIPPATPASAAAAASAPQRVEITGGRDNDTEARRRSTASKIVIGREEIDKFGDATVGEVLRRLPGVTTPGAPGRGGPPRMRGLGGGFTQLLIDGQRVPPGFSLESLTPEQVERIEILRAPTAETGARAIAGTINIITREGFKVRLNDLRIGFGVESGALSPGLNWTHNDTSGPLTYTLNAGVFRGKRINDSRSSTQVVNTDTEPDTLVESRGGEGRSEDRRTGLNLGGRLLWRLNDQNDSLALMPSIFHTEARGDGRFNVAQALRQASTPPFYDSGTTAFDSRFTNGRLGLMWRQRVGDVRLETNATGGLWQSRNDSVRNEFFNTSPLPSRTFSDQTSSREKSLNLTLKGSGLAGGGGGAGGTASAGAGTSPNPDQPAPEHSLVGGIEVEGVNRDETRVSIPDLADFGDNLKASSLRLAAYLQDEWQPTPTWGLHAGLRWEGITTRGDSGQGDRPTNRTSVWTPLLHAVWKPDPKSRDQLRISLTRSYRSPPLGALIARPTVNRDFPVSPIDQPNRETAADSAGNAALKPELATGIDVAVERYLSGGGVLSANLFARRISNLIRAQTALEDVPWSAFDRYVRRQRNIGLASTAGIELEAKFRLDQLIAGSLPVELRSNLSVYTSRVNSVPGPDNRLDQQAKASGNLGADYRLRSLPLTLGGNLNWVPGYTTRLDADQTVAITTKRVWDGYALWTLSPTVGLRLLGSNLDPRDFTTTTVTSSFNPFSGNNERSTAQSVLPNAINWQLRLELKL